MINIWSTFNAHWLWILNQIRPINFPCKRYIYLFIIFFLFHQQWMLWCSFSLITEEPRTIAHFKHTHIHIHIYELTAFNAIMPFKKFFSIWIESNNAIAHIKSHTTFELPNSSSRLLKTKTIKHSFWFGVYGLQEEVQPKGGTAG